MKGRRALVTAWKGFEKQSKNGLLSNLIEALLLAMQCTTSNF
jgi:hypothetical protein